MSNKAVNYFSPEFKFAPNWLVTSKMIKKFLTSINADEKYSTLMKILVMSYFHIMKWVFLMKLLIILILIKILMKMILMLLILSDFWLRLLNLKT